MDKVSVTIPGFVPAVSVQLRGVSGGGGTSDYNLLRNKPTLNGVEIKGNKTSEDYGMIGLSGGTAGQVLMKVSSADYDVAWTDLPAFAGSYDVTPLVGAQTTLSTQQRYLDRNIVVQAIPYAEVSNIKGGKTVTIGG